MTDTLRHTRPEGHDSEIRVGPPPRTSGGPRREPRIPSWALKVAAAVTGIIWAIFLAIHFYGNLKVFQGPEAFNNYAHWLKNAFYPLMPHEGVLWLMRAVLVPSLIIHVIAVFLIWQRARRSRGRFRAHISGFGARAAWLMPATGILTLVFIIYHVLDLTIGAQPAASSAFSAPTADASFAYQNLVNSFERPATAIFYMLIMVLLGLHIAKGFSNVAADLGAMGKRLRATLAAIGGLIAVAVLFGNAAIPVAVLAGWVS